MNPKKAKIYKEGIAQELNISEDVVDAFVEFYYEKLRQTLSNLVYPKVYVNNLGTFNIRRKNLNKCIKKQKDILGNLKKRTYNGYEKSLGIQEKIELYERALIDVNKMYEEKENFRKKHGME